MNHNMIGDHPPILPIEDGIEDWDHEKPRQLSLKAAPRVSNPDNHVVNGHHDDDHEDDHKDDQDDFQPEQGWIPVWSGGCHWSPGDLSSLSQLSTAT